MPDLIHDGDSAAAVSSIRSAVMLLVGASSTSVSTSR